jgi:hypothetical protein
MQFFLANLAAERLAGSDAGRPRPAGRHRAAPADSESGSAEQDVHVAGARSRAGRRPALVVDEDR